jgi:hypothetical protein
MLAGMLSLKMNDAAVGALGILTGLSALEPPGGLATGLRDLKARGIVRHGDVLTWAGSAGHSGHRVSSDLTAWECSHNSVHLEDFVPVRIAIVDDAPLISEEDQRLLLLHGLAFALEFARLADALDPPTSVRCIISANETNGTFRFHQIRPGEHWNRPDLDLYRLEKMIVLDMEPAE